MGAGAGRSRAPRCSAPSTAGSRASSAPARSSTARRAAPGRSPRAPSRAACAASSSSIRTTGCRHFVDYRNGDRRDAGTCYAPARATRRRTTGSPTRPGSSSSVRTARSGAFLLAVPGNDGALQSDEAWSNSSGTLTVRGNGAGARSPGYARPRTARWPAVRHDVGAHRAARGVGQRPPASAPPRRATATSGCSTVSRSPAPRTHLPATPGHGRRRAGGRRHGVRTRLQPGVADLRRTDRRPRCLVRQRHPPSSRDHRLDPRRRHAHRPRPRLGELRTARGRPTSPPLPVDAQRQPDRGRHGQHLPADVARTVAGRSRCPSSAGGGLRHHGLRALDSTARIRIGQLITTRPKIRGKAKVGKRVVAKAGRWTTRTKFRYQWFLGKRAIRGATSKKLRVTRAMRGKKLVVRVTGKKAGYRKATVRSRPRKVR